MANFYLDNFRGFSDEWVNLKQINFLMGENSSGKTTFLSALKILSEAFQGHAEFNSENISLGSFNDIYYSTKKEKNKSFFLGVCEFSGKEPKERYIDPYYQYAFILKFSEHELLPIISGVGLLVDGLTIHYKITNGMTEIALEKVEKFNTTKDFQKYVSTVFLDEIKTPKLNYEAISEEMRLIQFPFHMFAYIVPPLIKAKHENELKHARNYREPDILRYFIRWIAPIRDKPQRYYDNFKINTSSSGAHTPYQISKLLKSNEPKDRKIIQAINSFGKKSGLFEKIEYANTGKENEAPFTLNVCFGNKTHKINNVGYGVSQILPIIVDTLTMNEKAFCIIQQPEVHLHPKAQAAFGELLFQISKNDNKSFFVETHSDYTIDRFRLSLRHNKSIKKDIAQVLFFEKKKDRNKIHQINIDSQGNLSPKQPKSFRDFFLKEQIALITE